jgi:6-phosphogluconolactonase (cycloisomerase 2 family)
MRIRSVFAALLIAAGTSLVAAAAALASSSGGEHVVFVQTDEPGGNRIVSYDVAADGHLTRAGSFATGGAGGVAAPGSEPDHLASQGSLVYDGAHRLLIAVNAGSDTVSAFRVHGDTLELVNVVASGGQFPASVAVRGDLVYVLNSGGAGTVAGFRITNAGLAPIAGSARSLGLSNGNPPNFLTSPGQVGFTPSGSQLLVTTKASTSAIDVFQVAANGTLSASPVVNPSATPVPFAFTFTPTGRLATGEAAQATLSTYVVRGDGTLTAPRSLSDGQAALCWIQRVGQYYYVSNTGSANVSAFTISSEGQPALVGSNGVVATTEPGPIDETSPPGTSLLYVETGSGTVDEFQSNPDGTLHQIGRVDNLPAGIEGIASS